MGITTTDTTGSAVEIEFELRDRDCFFVDASAVADCRVELEHLVNRSDDRLLEYFTVEEAAPDRVLTMVEEADVIDEARLISRGVDGGLFEFVVSGPCVTTTLADTGAIARSIRAEYGVGTIVADVPAHVGRGDSKGWRLDSEESFRFLEKCVELGIENIHPHKGPTIRPLNRDAFDVGDVDDAASSFPDLNFVVEHIGFPRVDDFCHIATQETNVYGGLAVAAPFAQNRPRKFAEMMGELLFWVGEDNLLFGSDYGIWEPDWLVPAVMDAEFTQEERAEYGVELSPEVKRKIVGENAARLYDIDIEAKKEQFRDDAISQEFGLGDSYEEASAD